jgi:hypothetical protein
MRPIEQPYPLFTAPCVRCGRHGHSLNMACGDEPYTFVGFECQDDATREAVRLHSNKSTEEALKDRPLVVANARVRLGIRRPAKVPYDLSWSGCDVETSRA